MSKTQKERMIAGELYDPLDEELQREMRRAEAITHRFNLLEPGRAAERDALLRELFAPGSELPSLRAPFYCDYGWNITFAPGCFLNFGCVILDVCPVSIGEGTLIGPYVQILTADHPRDADVRASGLEFGRPIVIGRNVWIGGGAQILPGVSVGDGAVIGAGAVVTKDVAPNSTVAGNPARPVRG